MLNTVRYVSAITAYYCLIIHHIAATACLLVSNGTACTTQIGHMMPVAQGGKSAPEFQISK